MNWKNILQYALSILPISLIIEVFLDWMDKLVRKTENTLDDTALQIVRVILMNAGLLDQGQRSLISGQPGADGVPGLAREALEEAV